MTTVRRLARPIRNGSITSIDRDSKIHRVPVDGSGKSEAILDLPQGYSGAAALSFSPDGKTLAAALLDRAASHNDSAIRPRIIDSAAPARRQPAYAWLAVHPRRKVRRLCHAGERRRQHLDAATGRLCGTSGDRFQVGANLVCRLVARWKESCCIARSLCGGCGPAARN